MCRWTWMTPMCWRSGTWFSCSTTEKLTSLSGSSQSRTFFHPASDRNEVKIVFYVMMQIPYYVKIPVPRITRDTWDQICWIRPYMTTGCLPYIRRKLNIRQDVWQNMQQILKISAVRLSTWIEKMFKKKCLRKSVNTGTGMYFSKSFSRTKKNKKLKHDR